MSAEREKLWGKHGICHCGNCEAISMRAVAIAGKTMLDGECSQYVVALGVAIAAVGSMSLRGSVAQEMGDGAAR